MPTTSKLLTAGGSALQARPGQADAEHWPRLRDDPAAGEGWLPGRGAARGRAARPERAAGSGRGSATADGPASATVVDGWSPQGDTPVHALILTLDEERHIARCIGSLARVVTSVTVVDCGSTDRTVEIARALGARVLVRTWVNYATQMNFAIDAAQNLGGWLFRIDADEVLEPELVDGLPEFLARLPVEVAGVAVRRRIEFMGRRIRWGGIEPSWQLRIFRAGRGRCEERWMDEHIIVDGAVVRSPFSISDVNLKSVTWWTEKHNSYASREAIDLLDMRHGLFPRAGGAAACATSPGAALKRFIKKDFYARLPGGLRASLYFLWRYVVLLGVLDGRPGFFFHLFQAFWYRALVDAKVAEITAHAEAHGVPLTEAIRDRTGFDVSPARLPAGARLLGDSA